MLITPCLDRILTRAQEGIAPNKSDCVTLLNYPADSLEADVLRGVANYLARQRFGNEAIILGQIGVAIDACPAKCKFCSFGADNTSIAPQKMDWLEIKDAASRFVQNADLYALFLMTMHNFDFESLLETVQNLRSQLAVQPQIVVNIGDFDSFQAAALRQAGVNGAYHVCRLREGIDTDLSPENRKRTIRVIRDAGLDWYYCCEPIGPEHTSEELVEQIFLGLEYGCFQHAAMRRVWLPGSPLASFGQISELRLAQITAVVALASLACPETANIAVHEPNLIGLTSGANVVYAESGANPRDPESETSHNRGKNVSACKRMLYEAGFERLLVAPGRHHSLQDVFQA